MAERLFRVYAALILFSVAGTVAQAVTKINAGPIPAICSALLILIGVAALVAEFAQRVSKARAYRIFMGILAVGAAAELIGLYTGLPFGVYEYTSVWQPTVSLPGGKQFPLLLPFAWFMIVGSSLLSARSVIGGALLATFADFVMEPVIVYTLRYWTWEGGTSGYPAPALNFVGWLLVSFIGCRLARPVLDRTLPSRAPLILAMYLALLLVIHFAGPPPT